MARPKGKSTRSDKFSKLCKKLGHDPVEFNILVSQNKWQDLGFDRETYTVFTKNGDQYEMNHITLDHRLNANNKLLDFMHAKKKAIEFVDGENKPAQPTFVLNYNTDALLKAAEPAKKLTLNQDIIDVTPQPEVKK